MGEYRKGRVGVGRGRRPVEAPAARRRLPHPARSIGGRRPMEGEMNSLGEGPTSAHATRSTDPAALRGCRLHFACEGWNVPRASAGAFGAGTSQLARSATRFHAMEINSSFYRPHRWHLRALGLEHAARLCLQRQTPPGHHARDAPGWRGAGVRSVPETGSRPRRATALPAGLPPSLTYDSRVAGRFGAGRYAGLVALEPRHSSWFTREVDALLATLRFGRVLANPMRHDAGAAPGGWPQTLHLRLHGSPRMYWSRFALPPWASDARAPLELPVGCALAAT